MQVSVTRKFNKYLSRVESAPDPLLSVPFVFLLSPLFPPPRWLFSQPDQSSRFKAFLVSVWSSKVPISVWLVKLPVHYLHTLISIFSCCLPPCLSQIRGSVHTSGWLPHLYSNSLCWPEVSRKLVPPGLGSWCILQLLQPQPGSVVPAAVGGQGVPIWKTFLPRVFHFVSITVILHLCPQ